MKKILIILVMLFVNVLVFARDSKEPPIVTATKTGNVEVIKLLLNNGADINAVDYYGQSPLFFAIKEKNLELVKFLVENGAIVNTKEDGFGKTAFHYAISNQDINIIKYLIEKGAK